jgi:hydroxyacylglutathione hydrolase
VFTGDTLFVAGCGRFFEGNATQMHHALLNVLGQLPEETRVYCGHEYTVANLKFSLHVEPDNQATRDKLKWAEEQRSKQQRTIPSSIGQELACNPFMRVNLDKLKMRYNQTDAILCMQEMRKEKDSFKAVS